jgi:hypothetical protein
MITITCWIAWMPVVLEFGRGDDCRCGDEAVQADTSATPTTATTALRTVSF